MAKVDRAVVFDEQKAAAELERLHLAVEQAHRQRLDAEIAFEEFVRSFRTSANADTPSNAAAVDRPAPQTERLPRRTELPLPSMPPAIPTASPLALPAVHVPWWKAGRIRARDVAIASVGLAAIAGFVVVRDWRSEPPRAAAPERASAPPSADSRATPAAASAPEPIPPSEGRGLDAQLTATRPVWLRVTADGRRVVERELPAGTVLTFRAERTLALRVGDAGAVRLVVNGRDAGPLGPAGQIAVRTFTAPGR